MKKQDQIHIVVDLINKFREGVISPAESQELETWLDESDENRSLFTALTDKEILLDRLHSYSKANSEAIWLKTQQLVNPGATVVSITPVRRTWWKYTAAAAVVAILATGTWYYTRPVKQEVAVQQKDVDKTPDDVIVPGSSKAILTLADGKVMELDGASGEPIKDGNIVITKTIGRLIYSGESGANGRDPIAVGSSALYHTVSTPKGGQYQVTLPDGTVAWLNSASSLRFPIAFAGSERNVLLTGEAFFEVKKMHDKPFKVAVKTPLGKDGGVVEVLGTHFNVNAYTDEPFVRTTLLEGKVKVTTAHGNGILKPGQAANVALNGGLQVMQKADTDGAVAWKEGFFSFKGSSAQVVLQQVARWYNLDVQYQGKVPTVVLNGKIPRDYSIDEVMQVLTANGLHITLDRKTRRIIVMS